MGYVVPALVSMIAVALVAVYLLNSSPGFDPASVRGKRVVITGASSGLGQQLALEYARLGARLLLTGRREAALQSVAQKCREFGAPLVEVAAGDMTDDVYRSRLLAETEKRLGGLDCLVLNHADYSARSWVGSAGNLTDLDRTMNANFYSYVDVVSKAMPMLRRDGGAVGVVSSLAAKVPVPLLASYSASKAAQRSFFSALRQELRRDRSAVSVTTFLLGTIATDKYAGVLERHFPAVHSYLAASPQDAALAVVRGIATREAEVTYPLLAWFQYAFYLTLPEIYEYNLHHLSKSSVTN